MPRDCDILQLRLYLIKKSFIKILTEKDFSSDCQIESFISRM